ncbi:MAG: hypothetical protein ACI9MC_001337 [Kiritimatiellia bacterium]|jgi:hypothetical protein
MTGSLVYDLPFELHALAWSLCLPVMAAALLLTWAAAGKGTGSRLRRALFAFGPAALAAPVVSLLLRVVQIVHPDIGRSVQVWLLAWIPDALLQQTNVVLPDFAHPYDAALLVSLVSAVLVFFAAPLTAIIRRPRPEAPPALNGPIPYSLIVSAGLIIAVIATPWVLHRAMGAHVEWLILEWIAMAPVTALCLAVRLHAMVPPPKARADRALAPAPRAEPPDVRAAWIAAGVLNPDAKPLFQVPQNIGGPSPSDAPTSRSQAAWQAVEGPGQPPGALDTLLDARETATWLVGDLPLQTEAALVDAFLADAVGTRGVRALAVVPDPSAFAERHAAALTRVHTWTPGHVAVGAAQLREALARHRLPALTLVTPEELATDLLELVGRDGKTWAHSLDWLVLHRPDAGGPMQVTHTAFTLRRWALATDLGQITSVLATGADTPAVLSLLEGLFAGRPTRRCPLRPRERGPATVWPAALERSSNADPWAARACRATTALRVPTWLTDTEGHLDHLAHQDPLLTVDGDLDMPGLASAALLTVPSLPLAWRMAQNRLPQADPHHALWHVDESPVSRFLLHPGRMAAFHERRELPVPRPVVGTHNRFLRLAHLRAAIDDGYADEISLRRTFGDDVVDFALRDVERTTSWLTHVEAGKIVRSPMLRGPPGVRAPEPDRHTITPSVVQIVDDATGNVITRVDARLAITRYHPKRVFAVAGRRYRVPLHALDAKRRQLRVVPADPRDPLTRPVLQYELSSRQTIVDRVVRQQQGLEVATSTLQAMVQEQVVGAWVPGTDQREAFAAVTTTYDTEVRLIAVRGARRGPALTHLAHLVDALLPLHLCVDSDDVDVMVVDPPISPTSDPALAIIDRHVGGLGVARTLDDGTIIEILRWARAMLHACDCERGCNKCTPERVLIGGGDKAGLLALLS